MANQIDPNVLAALHKIGTSKVGQRSKYITPGSYLLELKKLEFDNKRGGLMFIAEFYVRQVTGGTDSNGNPVAPPLVGETVANIIKFTGPAADSAGGNVKAIVAALLGEDHNTISPEAINQAIIGGELVDEKGNKTQVPGLRDATQPGRGLLVKCDAVGIKTKAGNEFTALNWSSVEQSPEEVQARAAAQLAGKAA